MKRIFLLGSCLMLILGLAGCNSMKERKAEKTINTYYDALIEDDAATAYDVLYLYDDVDTHDKGTILSKEESKKLYQDKWGAIRDQGYEITGFKVGEVEYEDGHSFWHHIEVSGEKDGEPFEAKEVAYLKDGKLMVGSSDDDYAEYRNGHMDTSLTE